MGLVKLGDIARECRTTFVGSKAGIPIVGLEHLTPGDIELHSWDVDTDNTFNKSFKKGQVLLGRRRVYLKKAAVAPFDGICSGDITVIEAIPEKLLSGLLPFIIQNERFFDFALIGSAGSLSPRVKWEYLKDYELDLPDFEQQSKLVDLLTSANELKHSYQEMIKATDEIVKSQFIEMFVGKGFPLSSIREFALITTGSTPSKACPDYWGGNNPWVSAEDMKDKYVYRTTEGLTDKGYAICKHIPVNTLMYVCRGSIGVMAINKTECATNQSICTATCKDGICDVEYLYHALLYKKDDIQQLGIGTNFKSLNQTTFSNIQIGLPPYDKQMQFVDIAKHADKSKFELKQAIEKIEKVMRALMQ